MSVKNNGSNDLIRRGDALEAIRTERKIEQAKATGAIKCGRHERKQAQANCDMLDRLATALGNAELVPKQDAELRTYSYAKTEPHYRTMFSDETMTCQRCGYSRPVIRGERLFRCSCCGAIYALYEGEEE